MITTSPVFAMGAKVMGLTAAAVVVAACLFSSNVAVGSTQLALIGQQYFANGSGIAYFNDGTTQDFAHPFMAALGYYYDESTPFYIDEVPGIGNNNGSVSCGSTGAGSGGNITTITIIRGASLLSNKSRALDPSSIVHIRENDTVTWINKDTTSYELTSPPESFGGGAIPSGTFIDTEITGGETYSCTFTEHGGYHYSLGRFIKGAVIVEDEKDNNNTQSSTEQQQQQLSQSPFSQQLQSQQEERPSQSQQRSQGTFVSIVPASSSLTDTAFRPNPVQVSVGDTVIWTNDDTQPHTVTSGSYGQPDGKFDSSPNFNPLLAPDGTYQHTFTEAGEYPYYCALHPNMVGTVSVR